MKKFFLLSVFVCVFLQFAHAQKKTDKVNSVQTTITVDQVYQNNGRITGSQVKHYNGTGWGDIWTVPVYPNFIEGSPQKMWGDTLLRSSQKFHQWDRNGGIDVLNHQDILVNSSYPTWLSHFFPSYNATVQALLLDGGGAGTTGDPGVVSFADPWLIDYNDGYGLMNRGTKYTLAFWTPSIGTNNIGTSNSWYKGVFWNEGGGDWLSPHYSVSAPSPATVIGYSADFLNWSGSNIEYQNASATTGVKFTADNAVVTAVYKGRKLSSTPQAVGYSNQARCISGNNVVYGSANSSLWTLHYNGSTWTQDKNIVDGGINPCINDINMVTEYFIDSNERDIFWYQSTDMGVSWNFNTLWDIETNNTDATPVIQNNMIIWRESGGLYYWHPSLPTELKLNGTTPTSQHPSIAGDNLSTYKLVFQDGNIIYFQDFQNSIPVGTPLNLSNYTGNTNPCIAFLPYTNVAVVWERSGKIEYKECVLIGGVWRWPQTDHQMEFSHTYALSKPQVSYDNATQKSLSSFNAVRI